MGTRCDWLHQLWHRVTSAKGRRASAWISISIPCRSPLFGFSSTLLKIPERRGGCPFAAEVLARTRLTTPAPRHALVPNCLTRRPSPARPSPPGALPAPSTHRVRRLGPCQDDHHLRRLPEPR